MAGRADPRPWTAAELAELRRRYPTERTEDVARALRRSANTVYSKATVLGLRKEPGFASKRAREAWNGGALARRRWSDAQLELLRTRYANERTADLARDIGRPLTSVHRMAAKLGLRKDPELIARLARERSTRPDHGGARTRFQPGHVPWTAGRKGYDAGGRSHETRFKKGQRPHTWQPIGAERVVDGYLQRKVTDTGYTPRDYRPVHRLNWEAVHGPVPDGHALACLDGNRLNVDPANWQLVTRAELMRRNTYHRYPEDIRRAIQLRGVLVRKINERERQREERH